MPYVAPANNGTTAMGAVNYATEYLRALEQAFPYVLNFGALYNTSNNGRFRWVNAKTIEIPSISTTGRVNADRDTVAFAQRNYDNKWETKTLTNERKWSTLVHPMDIDQSNMVATIANITKVFNEEQKFPEMDAYTISRLFHLWTTDVEGDSAHGAYTGKTPDTTVLTAANILGVFDQMMLNMDNARVPVNGRILYVTNEVRSLLKNAQIDSNNTLGRSINVETGPNGIDRRINRLDEVQIIGVPAELMKTAYVFTTGWRPADSAGQINMFLVHPGAVITPVSYTFSRLDAPSAMSEGKYVYYEESFEDVFILNKKADALQFNITEGSGTTTTTTTTTNG
jgi:hypothetical protein